MQQPDEPVFPGDDLNAPQPAAAETEASEPDLASRSQSDLASRLEKAERAAEEQRENWLRARADTENMRRRMQADVANAHKYAIDNFSTEILAVKDAMEAALNIESTNLESLKNGVELTLRQLKAVFDKFNITEINPVGEPFDPHKHQAMTMVEFDAPPNTVVQVMQKGYQLNDRVIRPALVMVAK